MDFQTKCMIVSDCWSQTLEDEQWQWVHKQMNLGMPLAYAAVEDSVTLHDQGKQYVEQAYTLIAMALGLDEDGEYTSFDQMCELNIAMEE